MGIQRRQLLQSLALSALLPGLPPLHAQAWPNRPLRIVHGYDAGTNPDTTSRLLTTSMTERLGQPVIVESRPGAAGRIAAKYASTQPADGHTLLMLTAGDAVVAALDPKVPYRLLHDFDFVSSVIEFPFLICVASNSPFKSLADLLEEGQRRRGQLSYGTPGLGTTQSLAGELLQKTSGVELLHIPYKGNAFPDLLGGRVDFLIAAPSASSALIQSGKVRAIAVTSRDTYAPLPDIPPIQRTWPGFEVNSWLGLAVPRSTPKDVTRLLTATVQAVAATDSVRSAIAVAGSLPTTSTGEAFRARVEADVKKWSAFAGRVKLES